MESGRFAVNEIEPDSEGTRLGGREFKAFVDLMCSMIGSSGWPFADEK